MTPELLREAGEALYGTYWQAELSNALGMSSRHVRRLVDGTVPISDRIRTEILAIADLRAVALGGLIAKLKGEDA